MDLFFLFCKYISVVPPGHFSTIQCERIWLSSSAYVTARDVSCVDITVAGTPASLARRRVVVNMFGSTLISLSTVLCCRMLVDELDDAIM